MKRVGMMKRILLLAIASSALGLAASAGAQSVKAGIDAWQRGDHAEAIANWRPLAEKGDADASFNLGQAYRLGRGVALDLTAAQVWLERAARKGHVDAQATLGLLLFQNGNSAGGLRWLRSAAEKGEPRALLTYGTALFNGDGVSPDPVLAYAYVSRAAAQGLAPAKTTLAEMDKVLPLELRQRGVAIALDKAKAAAAPEASAKLAPQPKETSSAPSSTPVPAASGNWRIQLGAFSSRSAAEALFKRLSGTGALAGRKPFLTPAGAMTRLQVGPFESRSAAAAACKALTARGQACFPVAAK